MFLYYVSSYCAFSSDNFLYSFQPSSSALITTSCYALQQGIEFHGKTREPVTDKQLYDQLDSASKKLQDLLKKQKCLNLRNEIGTRWDRFKAGFQLYLKSKDSISVQTSPMIDIYREVFRSYFNEKMLQIEEDKPQLLDSIWRQIKSDTDDFWGFLKVKANQNLSMECTDSLSINKYLEEFPGLVHFIYIDRNKHTVIMPTMDFSREETVRLTKSKVFEIPINTFLKNKAYVSLFSFFCVDLGNGKICSRSHAARAFLVNVER